ncbi:protein phosphatase 2C domain-containing protein [Devosia sp.]|uniref:protein phosphatase 2C domain-containing protein n=1 Tax=Devosia sp. TaxID=1871048 RepID=UPI003A90D5FE
MGDEPETEEGMALVWSGSLEPCLSAPVITRQHRATLGRYGGTSGKNEDGALVWSEKDWTFAVILDGHASSESVNAVLAVFEEARSDLRAICSAVDAGRFTALQRDLITLLTSPDVTRRMAAVRGETACLICYQSGKHLLWLSIGDATLYLLHPELARLGQYTLTTRNFFEWIGERTSVAGAPACFSTGIRELRQGRTIIVLVTDGIQELPTAPFDAAADFSAAMLSQPTASDGVAHLLQSAEALASPDSCTLIAWEVDNPEPALMPSG